MADPVPSEMKDSLFLGEQIVAHYRDGIAHEIGKSNLQLAQQMISGMCEPFIAKARAEGAAAAAERIAELEAALDKYAEHRSMCRIQPCTCGLDAALAQKGGQ